MLLPYRAGAASDASALEAGRSAGRMVLIMSEPGICGIALVHERCKADVDAFLTGKRDADFSYIPKIGSHPATGLRAFVTSGDRDGFDFALGWLNSRASTPAMWNSDARSAALYDAGIEDVMLPSAQGKDVLERLRAGPIIDLANHAAQIPAATLPVDIDPIRPGARGPSAGIARLPPGAMQFAHDLVTAIDKAMPAPPLVRLTFSEGSAGDASLGVASATVNELVDSPAWLAQADAQEFVDEYCARLMVVKTDQGGEVTALRSALRVDTSFSRAAARKANTAILAGIVQKDGGGRTKPVLLGMLAAQMVYNAAILRDPRMGKTTVQLLGGEPALDAVVPGWGAARESSNGLRDDAWSAQYQLGLHLVDLIRSANAT